MVFGSILLTTIFVLVDDWYQQKGYRYVASVDRKVLRSHLGNSIFTFLLR
ncbi:MAG: hypothetical protein V7L31_23440 [Nostoc sp.]